MNHQDDGIIPDSASYLQLLRACGQSGDPEGVLNIGSPVRSVLAPSSKARSPVRSVIAPRVLHHHSCVFVCFLFVVCTNDVKKIRPFDVSFFLFVF